MDINTIAENFSIGAEIESIKPYGNGHINDTFLVTLKKQEKKFILQRVNDNVFKEPEKVMHNIISVTEYLKKHLSGKMQTLELIPLNSGEKFLKHESGIWRMYKFIENSVSLDLPEKDTDFYMSAVAFGQFQSLLKDFDASGLFETIKDFHNTPVRYENFLKALEQDPEGRAKEALKEIEFIKERKDFYCVLENARKSGKLPLKVTHNDTKLNNVMLDKFTREPICVIDLDTVMPGYSVNDFGDSIRFGASTAAEDEKDLNKVDFNLNMFEIYTKGFLNGCNKTLTESEISLLPTGALMMTLECGMRFLTDFILGDTYFKTAYRDHNLTRCRTQLKLARKMEENFDKMNETVKKYAN